MVGEALAIDRFVDTGAPSPVTVNPDQARVSEKRWRKLALSTAGYGSVFLRSFPVTESPEFAAVDDIDPHPTPPTGARVGYARVSTAGQLLDRRLAALEAAGCIRGFADKKSGKNAERAEL